MENFKESIYRENLISIGYEIDRATASFGPVASARSSYEFLLTDKIKPLARGLNFYIYP
jgi:hypothetical protein